MNGSGGDPALREFCGSGNHDPQDLTAQSHRFAGASCWETIAQRMGTQGIVVTAPSVGTVDTGVPPDAESIGLRGLAKERRMVLVLDRSGSMAESNKAEGARLAVTVWLQSHATTVPVLPERLGVITYNSEPATLVPLQVLTQQQATAFEDEIHEALEPGGATNIRDALDDAADMLIDLAASPQGGGRAVYQGVVLVSDGVHNTPPPSTEALSVIPRFKENGIPIFTLALGSSSDVDLTTLEELARQTGGRAFVSAIDAAAGTDQSTKVAGDIIIMNQQFRGTAAVYEELDFDALPAGLPLSAKLAVWASHGSRPKELSEIFEVAGVGSISQLMQAHPGRARLIGCLVEEGAERLEVLALFPPKHDTWLYLVDPIGRALPPNEIKAIRGPGAFDGAIVEQPIAGQWVAILIRVAHGPRFAAIASVGIENRRLAVAGGCDHWVAAGVPARLWARATFGDELSGLVVRARLRGPDGQPHDVVLSDARPDEPFSGIYEGFFAAPSPGLYTGRITISNKGGAKIANGFDRSFHSRIDPRKGGKLDLSSGVSPFSRTLRVYCEVGARSKPKDRDVALGLTGKNPRPTLVKT
jgi:Mg-chelatase subunit ChlD